MAVPGPDQRPGPAPDRERDACGIGFVARVSGEASHDVVESALVALASHAHRGAIGADGKTGDGAGVLCRLPYPFFARELERALGARAGGLGGAAGAVPAPGDLALGQVFAPRGDEARARAIIEEGLRAEGLEPLAWREVPVDLGALGRYAAKVRPEILQVFVRRGPGVGPGDAFELALYRARKRFVLRARTVGPKDLYVPSLSHRTIVYKGLLLAPYLGDFFADLRDPLFASPACVFHQRYSTNTRPSWKLAQPFRLVCHNGEINTIEGNFHWMRAREAAHHTTIWGEGHADYYHVIDETGSDSSQLDNALELFVRQGYDVRHALLMMVPEAWEGLAPGDMPGPLRAFYRFHESFMEPWDGPAALAFLDGRHVGMTLDRNGLRPARVTITSDGLVVAASEAGALAIDERRVARKGMLGPGEMIAVDLERHEVLPDRVVKSRCAGEKPYAVLAARRFIPLDAAERIESPPPGWPAGDDLTRTRAAFGYTSDEEVIVFRSLVAEGREPVGSMGDDTALAALSPFHRPLFHYFKQRFAQVTNPPIDPIREEIVMSCRTHLGRRGNVLNPLAEDVRLLECEHPILDPAQLARVEALARDSAFRTRRVDTTWPVERGPAGLLPALERVVEEAETAVDEGARIVVLHDRAVGPERTFVPSLLAVAAVNERLIRTGKRLQASIVIDSGEPREVHDLACLIGFGAGAVHPWLVYAGAPASAPNVPLSDAIAHFRTAAKKGLLKVMSKMGIAHLASYRGARIFEAIGLARELCARWFPGTESRLGGVGLERIARDVLAWHAAAYAGAREGGAPRLRTLGFYKPKAGGEVHAFSPAVVHALHAAVGLDPKKAAGEPAPPPAEASGGTITEAYRRYADLVHERPPVFLRDLLGLKKLLPPVPLAEVEPAPAILRRFSTGGMSHGSLSSEAHRNLAIALNRLGAQSNAGEGGEDEDRFGTEASSAIKQVASGRFGVTAAYLVSARELQIKMAQGSKPGEGGQLPGHKVSAEIARIRHTTPGVALISPPPHHDIYSIEDLAQLIYDLKQANPQALISVKLVSETGVGTIAAGVAKGYADTVHLAGHSGGTGASPLGSIKHAGLPWELGLAEAQRALIANRLRDRVRLRVDGSFQTGRDVVLAALLGADEVSFGTAALIAEGCIMARTCHTNNCPVGVASQRPDLRAKFPGRPEHVVSFLRQVAEEVRETMASLGFRTFDEMVGRVEFLEQAVCGEAVGSLDLAPLLQPPVKAEKPRRAMAARNDPPGTGAAALGEEVALTVMARLARAHGNGAGPIVVGDPEPLAIRNTERTVGARLGGEIARRFGAGGLAPGAVRVRFRGAAGQSFGAFLPRGVAFDLEGEANDYVGKGLSGGEVAIRPPAGAPYASHENAIVGNTVLYGATAGRLFAAGRAGQRLCVRMSGATAVVEGAGDHCCEYMTGGVAVILGHVGRNFGAGMTGGVAYVLDDDGRLGDHLNPELVEARPVSSPAHEAELRDLVREHFARTASARARALLDGWEAALARFRRVAPREAVATIENANEGVTGEAAAAAR